VNVLILDTAQFEAWTWKFFFLSEIWNCYMILHLLFHCNRFITWNPHLFTTWHYYSYKRSIIILAPKRQRKYKKWGKYAFQYTKILFILMQKCLYLWRNSINQIGQENCDLLLNWTVKYMFLEIILKFWIFQFRGKFLFVWFIRCVNFSFRK